MKKIKTSILACAAVALLAGCSSSGNNQNQQQVTEKIQSVSVAKVGTKEIDLVTTYTSTVEANVKNNIAPQIAGRIKSINVEVGDFVKKGQVLAEMDKANLKQVELQMKNNKLEYERLQGLFDAGALAQSDLDAIRLAYEVSKTNYENLLENTVLVSPIDGVVTARNYDKGDMFAMASPIYTVQQIKPVKLYVGISEADYTKVSKGDEVTITVEALPGRTFTGKINRINPIIDSSTHTFKVEIIVANADTALRPGMFARVAVNFGTRTSVIVPDVAVVKQTGSGERFVYVLNEDGTVSFTNVKVGLRMGTEYEILEGLEEGATIVVGGQQRLKNGVKVNVEE